MPGPGSTELMAGLLVAIIGEEVPARVIGVPVLCWQTTATILNLSLFPLVKACFGCLGCYFGQRRSLGVPNFAQ